MEKRYQVFVSSTYADLREERQRVIQALMEMDCIPSGMELFPAADEEQWHFIKRVIDDCDYYLLIIGGRYGSTTPDGISYTEKEYDYAIQRGMKVVALLHSNPDEIPLGKSEGDPELRKRLTAFKEKVAANRLVKFWSTASELPGLVALSLSKTIKTYPAVGWIRADQVGNTELLSDINELRKRKEELEQQLSQPLKSATVSVPNLAPLEDSVTIFGYTSPLSGRLRWECQTTWKGLFAMIAPFLVKPPSDDSLKRTLAEYFCEKKSSSCLTPSIDDDIYHTIRIQFEALGLIKVEYSKTIAGGADLFWYSHRKVYHKW
ncbi:MAG TPA: DUF4062 domain-containing protein [Pyrinomonadaceae bacterium]|nr:DUF4062 domain-containing protein [Pyrinomonadaceae bacterium]